MQAFSAKRAAPPCQMSRACTISIHIPKVGNRVGKVFPTLFEKILFISQPFDFILVRPGGFEPPAKSLEGSCSIHLSYGRVTRGDFSSRASAAGQGQRWGNGGATGRGNVQPSQHTNCWLPPHGGAHPSAPPRHRSNPDAPQAHPACAPSAPSAPSGASGAAWGSLGQSAPASQTIQQSVQMLNHRCRRGDKHLVPLSHFPPSIRPPLDVPRPAS